MAKNFTFHQIAWDCGAVYGNERTFAARTQIVRCFRTEFFADATLTSDEYGPLSVTVIVRLSAEVVS